MNKRFRIFIFLSAIAAIPLLNAQDPNVSVIFNPSTSTIKAVSTSATPTATQNSKDPKKNGPADASDANIYLNFENVSLASVVNYLSERKKINLVPHKDLETPKVSLSTRKPLTLDRAWDILLTLLEMNGFSIIQVDNLYRVVANKDNGVEPLPYYSSQTTPPDELPASDLAVRYIYFFKNIKPEIALDILKSMLDGDKNVQLIKDLQAVIIKEKCHNIKAALKIIKELDTGGLRQSIRIVPLKEADADTVQKLFSQDILGGDGADDRLKFITAENPVEAAYFSSTTKIISDPSKNSLILLGTPSNIDKICNFIYKYVDVPIGSAESRIHIKELRFAKADTLKPILENIIKPPAGQGSDKSSVIGQFKFFEDVIIAADAGGGDENRGAGNRLIISANQGDWSRLEEFIEKLDKPSPQVAFEVMVVDINLAQDKQLGAQLQSKGLLGADLNRVTFNNLTGLSKDVTQEATAKDPNVIPAYKFTDIISSLKSPGTFVTLGKTGVGDSNHLWALLQSVFTVNNSHVVSQPYLVTNNFQECSMTVGETRRIPGPLISEKGETARQQKVEKPADTDLKLTPQINVDGVVNLKLEMSFNQFGANDPNTGPPMTKRTMHTRVSMSAGEVLVLGGMTKSHQDVSAYRTPLLSSIPILGNLFRSTVKKKSETNLYVFIRPSIIKPNFDGAPDEYTQLKLDYAKYQMIKNDAYTKEQDPVQRWFFKPTNHSIKSTLADARNGIFRPIDNFTYGRGQPKTVDIKHDPYFRAAATIENSKQRAALKSRKKTKA
jgi:general secretion pathway protein D